MTTAPTYIPPHSNDAEIAVLGSVMLDNDTLHEDALSELEPAMFHREHHRRIFDAMRQLQQRGEPVDLVTLREILDARKQLDDVGGLPYLIGLGEQVPTAAYAAHYARIVKEKWAARELIRQANKLSAAAYEGQTALEDMLTQASQIGSDLNVRANQGAYSIADIIGEIHADMDRGEGEKPLPTGFTDLDQQLSGGLYPSTLNILAARPSMGKSALALNIADNVAQHLVSHNLPGQVVIVSLEMPRKQLVVRMLASEAKMRTQDVKLAMRGERALTDSARKRFEAASLRLAVQPMTFADDSAFDGVLGSLTAKLRRMHKTAPLRLVVIDYLQLMSARGAGANENRQQEISTISRALKVLSRELECPVLALSQLSRAVEQRPNHRPMLSDLRESGAVEQDADNVMFIYRDEYYNKETDQQGVAEIIVGKQRDGATGTVKLQFHSAHVRFHDLSPEQF